MLGALPQTWTGKRWEAYFISLEHHHEPMGWAGRASWQDETHK